MKKLISTAATILISVVLMAQTSANLKLNLEKNKTYRVKTSSEQNTMVTYGGAPQQIETKSSSTLLLKPVSSGTDFIIADIRFDSIITKISMPKMEMNSSNPGNIKSSNPSEVMDCFLNRLSMSTFNVKFSLTGKVIEITNLKAISDDVTKGLDSLQGQMGMMKTQISMLVSEGSIKGMIESITANLPGKQVQVGDKWDSNIALTAGGMGMLINSTYKLKKITGKSAEIASESTIEPASQAPMEMNGAQISYDVRGLGKSTLIVDTQTGLVVKLTSKYHNQGNMNIKAQGNDMQMPLEIDGTTEVVSIP